MRETKKIKGPSGVSFEIKTYFTVRESREILKKLSVNGLLSTKPEEMTIDSMEQYQDELVKQGVVSIGEKSENIIDESLELCKEDYDFLITKLGAMNNLKKKQEKD